MPEGQKFDIEMKINITKFGFNNVVCSLDTLYHKIPISAHWSPKMNDKDTHNKNNYVTNV